MAFQNSHAEARPRIPLWVTLMALAFLALPQFATVRAQKAPVVFGTEIALVQVPVFVSRSDGSAALGLTQADFVVEQDGKEIPIVAFRAVDTTLSGDSQEAIKQSSAARRRFLLLFDTSFTDPAGLARARKAAKEFVLHDLADSDLAAVATFDFLRGVRLVANFTEDRRVLDHAIHTLGVSSLSKISDPLAIAADFQTTDLVRDRALSSADTPQELMTQVLSVLVRQMQSAEQQAYRARVETLLQGLRGLGSSLQRIPGRKQILYFSTGFNSSLLAGQDTREQKRMSEAITKGRIWEVDASERYGDSAFRGEVDDALLAFTRSDSVIHTIDLSGLGSSENYAQLPAEAQPSRDASGRDSLALIAAETGGRFFKDANDLRPVLREVADLTSRYYVLGVQPREGKADGRFRKLRVRVKTRGLRASHRPGFFERSEAPQAVAALERQFEAAELLIGQTKGAASPPNQVPFRVLIIPVPANDVNQSLGIVVQVPDASMGSGAGALELFGYAITKSGAVADHFAHFIRLNTSDGADGGATSGVSFSGRFDVPPGDYTLKFLVQRASGEASARYFDVTVPQRRPAQGFLLPPLFQESSSRWIAVDLKKGADSGLPLKINLPGAPFVPRTEITVRPGRPERLILVSYDPETAEDPAADVDIRSSLSDDAGNRFPPGFISVEHVLHDTSGKRLYVLKFIPEEVPAGDYILRLHLGEANSLLQSYCRLTVLSRESAAIH